MGTRIDIAIDYVRDLFSTKIENRDAKSLEAYVKTRCGATIQRKLARIEQRVAELSYDIADSTYSNSEKICHQVLDRTPKKNSLEQIRHLKQEVIKANQQPLSNAITAIRTKLKAHKPDLLPEPAKLPKEAPPKPATAFVQPDQLTSTEHFLATIPSKVQRSAEMWLETDKSLVALESLIEKSPDLEQLDAIVADLDEVYGSDPLPDRIKLAIGKRRRGAFDQILKAVRTDLRAARGIKHAGGVVPRETLEAAATQLEQLRALLQKLPEADRAECKAALQHPEAQYRRYTGQVVSERKVEAEAVAELKSGEGVVEAAPSTASIVEDHDSETVTATGGAREPVAASASSDIEEELQAQTDTAGVAASVASSETAAASPDEVEEIQEPDQTPPPLSPERRSFNERLSLLEENLSQLEQLEAEKHFPGYELLRRVQNMAYDLRQSYQGLSVEEMREVSEIVTETSQRADISRFRGQAHAALLFDFMMAPADGRDWSPSVKLGGTLYTVFYLNELPNETANETTNETANETANLERLNYNIGRLAKYATWQSLTTEEVVEVTRVIATTINGIVSLPSSNIGIEKTRQDFLEQLGTTWLTHIPPSSKAAATQGMILEMIECIILQSSETQTGSFYLLLGAARLWIKELPASEREPLLEGVIHHLQEYKADDEVISAFSRPV